MNPKLKKMNREYERNAMKIELLLARNQELAKKRTELENLEIIGMVRETGMTLEELALLLRPCREEQLAVQEEPEYEAAV